ncbi:MAG: TRAP transporter small permease subunit [Candidatus Velthaea sp.]
MEAAVNAVSIAFLVALTLITAYEVFTRYVLSVSHAAADDLERYLLVNGVFLSASAAYRRNAHVRVELLLGFAPPRARRIMLALTDLLGIAVSGFLTWQSVAYDRNLFLAHLTSTSSFGAPLWIVALGLPIGFALLALVFAEHLIRVAAGDMRSDPIHLRDNPELETLVSA